MGCGHSQEAERSARKGKKGGKKGKRGKAKSASKQQSAKPHTNPLLAQSSDQPEFTAISPAPASPTNRQRSVPAPGVAGKRQLDETLSSIDTSTLDHTSHRSSMNNASVHNPTLPPPSQNGREPGERGQSLASTGTPRTGSRASTHRGATTKASRKHRRAGRNSSAAPSNAPATTTASTIPRWKRYTDPRSAARGSSRMHAIQSVSSGKMARIQKWIDFSDQGTSPLGPLLDSTSIEEQIERERRLKDYVDQGIPVYAQNSSVDDVTESERRRSTAATSKQQMDSSGLFDGKNQPGMMKFRSRVFNALNRAKKRHSVMKSGEDEDGDSGLAKLVGSRRKSVSMAANVDAAATAAAAENGDEAKSEGNADDDGDDDEDITTQTPTGSLANLGTDGMSRHDGQSLIGDVDDLQRHHR